MQLPSYVVPYCCMRLRFPSDIGRGVPRRLVELRAGQHLLRHLLVTLCLDADPDLEAHLRNAIPHHRNRLTRQQVPLRKDTHARAYRVRKTPIGRAGRVSAGKISATHPTDVAVNLHIAAAVNLSNIRIRRRRQQGWLPVVPVQHRRHGCWQRMTFHDQLGPPAKARCRHATATHSKSAEGNNADARSAVAPDSGRTFLALDRRRHLTVFLQQRHRRRRIPALKLLNNPI